MFEELRGKVALVTGASQGIGRVIAGILAGQDMAVMLADLQDEKGAAGNGKRNSPLVGK